ncbi:MAG: polyhydroxyalkanoate depolymerase, partial [Hydrogenophaga sp.]|nr:polyhydroxyalkanoate depolymerase [Hydrogenophaga sp.]
DITHTALLTIEGELDDISGCGQTAAAHGLCSGIPQKHQMHYEAKGAGHYGIFSGRRWREMVYPVVKSFILAHQAGMVAATPAGQVKGPTEPARPRKQARPAARVPAKAAKGKPAGKRSPRPAA